MGFLFFIYVHVAISDIKPLNAAMETQQWVSFFYLRACSNQ